MKKLFKTAALAAALLLAAPAAHAQKLTWGITGGLNLTKLKVYGSATDYCGNFSSDNRNGWFIGPSVQLGTPIGIGLDAALEYSQRRLNITYDNTVESKTYRTIEVPVNVSYAIGLGKMASVYIATGPQFGFSLNKMEWGNVGSGKNFSRENLNTTWNVGAGIRLLSRLDVGIGYNFGLHKAGKAVISKTLPTGDSQDYELKYKTNTFQVKATVFLK